MITPQMATRTAVEATKKGGDADSGATDILALGSPMKMFPTWILARHS